VSRRLARSAICALSMASCRRVTPSPAVDQTTSFGVDRGRCAFSLTSGSQQCSIAWQSPTLSEAVLARWTTAGIRTAFTM